MSEISNFLDWLVPKGAIGNLERIGGTGDGAYLVPDDLKEISACFSPGTANRKDFEDELLDKFSIKSHMMDASSDVNKLKTPLRDDYQSFEKSWLGPDEELAQTSSMSSWVERREPTQKDLLLQMDIEGAEYANLKSWDEALTKRFRIMVIELHGLGQIADNPEAFVRDKLPAFNILRSTHSVVHAHPNNCCSSKEIDEFPMEIPNVLEITLLRNDRLRKWRKGHKKTFDSPHANDIGWNVIRNEPLFLGGEWSRGSSSTESELRKASIQASWLYQRQYELLRKQMFITKSTLESSDWKGGLGLPQIK